MDIICFFLAVAVSVAVWTVLGVLADLEAEKIAHSRTRDLLADAQRLHEQHLDDLRELLSR